jgi:hypothetical protein
VDRPRSGHVLDVDGRLAKGSWNVGMRGSSICCQRLLVEL